MKNLKSERPKPPVFHGLAPEAQILAHLVHVERPRFEALFDRCLDVIERALAARRIVASNHGREAMDVGFAHSTALAWAAQTIRMMTVGRFRPKTSQSSHRYPLFHEIEEATDAALDMVAYRAAEQEHLRKI